MIKELNLLSHVIDTAIRDWSLPLVSNPVKLVRKPKAARGRDRRFQGDEEERFIAACKAWALQPSQPSSKWMPLMMQKRRLRLPDKAVQG